MATISGVWEFDVRPRLIGNPNKYFNNLTFIYSGSTYHSMHVYNSLNDSEGIWFDEAYTFYNIGSLYVYGIDVNSSEGVSEWRNNERTIDFGTTPQNVDDAFYNWFTDNATFVAEPTYRFKHYMCQT